MQRTNRDIALEYLRCFCAGDIHGLEPLFDNELTFTGPYHTFSTAAAYLDSLRTDLPDECNYNVLSVTENEDTVAVFYEYQKPERTLHIAQLFKFNDHKIIEIRLIF